MTPEQKEAAAREYANDPSNSIRWHQGCFSNEDIAWGAYMAAIASRDPEVKALVEALREQQSALRNEMLWNDSIEFWGEEQMKDRNSNVIALENADSLLSKYTT